MPVAKPYLRPEPRFGAENSSRTEQCRDLILEADIGEGSSYQVSED